MNIKTMYYIRQIITYPDKKKGYGLFNDKLN